MKTDMLFAILALGLSAITYLALFYQGVDAARFEKHVNRRLSNHLDDICNHHREIHRLKQEVKAIDQNETADARSLCNLQYEVHRMDEKLQDAADTAEESLVILSDLYTKLLRRERKEGVSPKRRKVAGRKK